MMSSCPAASYADSTEVVSLSDLEVALTASWDSQTANQGVSVPGNPAFGQCYPTSRVVQWFYPEYEIAKGKVWTGASTEVHYWNVCGVGADVRHLDLSWQQFPVGSVVCNFEQLDRRELGDSRATMERCELLLQRVTSHLAQRLLEKRASDADGHGRLTSNVGTCAQTSLHVTKPHGI